MSVVSINTPPGAVVTPGAGRAQWAAALIAAAALLICVALGSASKVSSTVGRVSAPRGPAALEPSAGVGRPAGLSALPTLAQGSVSAALGAGDAAYRVSDLRAVNPAQRLRVSFSSAGPTVTSGAGSLALSLVGRGGRRAERASTMTVPRARANRVTYRRAGLTEWYENGPLGLEQGFTVARRPADRSDRLVLALNVAGNLRPRLDGAGVLLAGAGARLLYRGLGAVDAHGRPLRSWFAVRGRRVLIEIADHGAAFPLRIDPFIQQGSKLLGSGATGEAEEGHSVAISADGNTALVGAPAAVAFGTDGPGVVYVFIRSGQAWAEQAKLTSSDPAFGAQASGWSVALSTDGNTALIGGPGPAIHAGDPEGPGGAWVFTRSGQSWSQQGPRLNGTDEVEDPDPTVHGTAFGGSVALSGDGNTALIGGSEDDDFHGAAWMFTRSGQTWSQFGPKLEPSDAAISDPSFGFAVALSRDGRTALIGGVSDRTDLGSAWVFARSGQTWSQQGPKLVPSGETLVNGGFFGASDALSADGNTALIGAAGGTPGASSSEGGVWAFTRSGQTWSQQGPRLHPTDEPSAGEFGTSVALSADGNTALIGGPDDPFGAAPGAGDAWEFTRAGGAFTQRTPTLTASDESGAGAFGNAVALSGDGETALVGAPIDGDSLGAAWVFSRAAPQITSTASATFVTGRPGRFAVTTDGIPTPSVSESGALPRGLSFAADGAGGATLAGTPAAGTDGVYRVTISSANGNAPDASQTLVVTVQAPLRPTVTTHVVAPDNHFTVSHIHPLANGKLTFSVKVPGAGRIDVLETAWNDNLARTAILLQPAKRRFVYARAHRAVTHGGVTKVVVSLNARGRRLVAHHRYRVTLRLWVSYTPRHGVPRSKGFHGLHLRRR